MRRNSTIFFLAIIVALGVFFFEKYIVSKKSISPAESPSSNFPQSLSPLSSLPEKNEKENADQNSSANMTNEDFQPPLDRANERVIKKFFGIFVTPQNSPVQPERFRGYHTGTDFEIFPEETDTDVPVHAICSGTIVQKRTASGYGGVLVERCTLDGQPVTVIYGHLKLASITKNSGDDLNMGDEIGILGKGYSSETSGERKHLHLAIHKGKAMNILGYVQSKNELSSWVDPCQYVCY